MNLSPRILLLTLGLASCDAINTANLEIEGGKTIAEQLRADNAKILRGEVIYPETSWFGDPVSVKLGKQRGEPLPKSVEKANSTAFKFNGDIYAFAKLVQEQTNITVSVATRFTDLNQNIIKMPISTRLKLNRSGALSAALDEVGSRTDTEWYYDGSTVVFTRMVNRSYSLSIPLGQSNFNISASSITTGGDTSLTTSRQGTLDVWASTSNQLKNVVTYPSQFQLDQQSSTLSVFGPPSVHQKVENIINKLNNLYNKKIGIEVGAYYVDSSKVDDFAASINSGDSDDLQFVGLSQAISGNGVATIPAGAGGLEFSFRAISKLSSVFDFQQGSATSQNGVWANIKIQTNTNYVANTSTTNNEGVITTSLETATVDEGLSISVLPRILENDQIQMQLTVVQKTLSALDSFEAGGTKVQLPKIDSRQIQSDVVLTPGETLILAGYEQDSYQKSGSGPGSPLAFIFGGTKYAKVKNIRLILLVRLAIISNKVAR